MLVNDIKEQLCYVSLDFEKELDQLTHNKSSDLCEEYVLPDYNKIFKGFVKPKGTGVTHEEQTIKMHNSRILVPEVLFNPSDIGIHQAGVAEMVGQVVSKCNDALAPRLYSNILITGGNTKFPNFKKRLEHELEQICP